MTGKERIARAAVTFAGTFLLTAGSILCLLTAFDIPATIPLLILTALMASFLFSVFHALKHGWIGTLAVCLAGAAFFIYNGRFVINGFFAVITYIHSLYQRAYPNLLPLAQRVIESPGKSTDILLAGYSILTALFASLSFWKKHVRLIAALLSLVLIIPSLMIYTEPPSAISMIMIAAAYLIMLFSTTGQAKRMTNRYRLVALLMIPILLFSIFAGAFSNAVKDRPQWTEKAEEKINEWSNTLFSRPFGNASKTIQKYTQRVSPTLGGMGWDENPQMQDLTQIGEQRDNHLTALEVMTDNSGPLYLRGYSLAVYEKTRWRRALEESYGNLQITRENWQAPHANYQFKAQFRTERASEIYYTPYYPISLPDHAVAYYDAAIENGILANEYTVYYSPDGAYPYFPPAYISYIYSVYQQVPPETFNELTDILREIMTDFTETDTPIDRAEKIGDYVRESARYSLSTPRMPEGEDFVVWFLKNSDTGNCVHFASAATILLRCFGIPARYVVGFATETEANEWTDVEYGQAHAWTEYYVSGLGWRVLDATPGETELPIIPETPDDRDTEITKPDRPDTPPEPDDTENPVPQTDPDSTEQSGQPKHKPAPVPAQIFVLILGLALLWRIVGWHMKQYLFGRGDANTRALRYYRAIVGMYAKMKETVPEDVLYLARKARFGKGALTESETGHMKACYLETCERFAREKHPLKWLYSRFILAL